METSTIFDLVFIPAPGFSQFPAEMDLAHRLAAHDPRISVTVILADIPISDHSLDSYFKSLNSDHHESPRVSIVRLPPPQIHIPHTDNFLQLFSAHMEAYKSVVKEIVVERTEGRRRLAGFVLDMFCSTMLDVAEELRVPSYFFFASGATMLSFMFHFEGSLAGKIPSTPELQIPGFKTPLPETAWPAVIKNPNSAAIFLRNTRQMLRSKGVLPNTFNELETDLIRSLSENSAVPPIYPIGPIVHVDATDSSKKQLSKVDGSDSSKQKSDVEGSDSSETPLFDWLNAQPPKSVVFLCFGTRGAFSEEQVRQIAAGLERSGHRFLWSLRRRPESGKGNDYADFNEVLPEGFLDRTRELGRVVRWAPQREVLSHPSTGSFVSHCGWNSLLESMWLGVPVAAWPLFAEQQLNAYHWARELGIATEMRIDYSYDAAVGEANVVVDAAEVEAGIRRVMEGEEGVKVRKKLEEMSLAAKAALLDGGSSHRALSRFVDDVVGNVTMKST